MLCSTWTLQLTRALQSRMDRSTIRDSSAAHALWACLCSNTAAPMGDNSTLNCKKPSVGLSGNGDTTSPATTAKTLVRPNCNSHSLCGSCRLRRNTKFKCRNSSRPRPSTRWTDRSSENFPVFKAATMKSRSLLLNIIGYFVLDVLICTEFYWCTTLRIMFYYPASSGSLIGPSQCSIKPIILLVRSYLALDTGRSNGGGRQPYYIHIEAKRVFSIYEWTQMSLIFWFCRWTGDFNHVTNITGTSFLELVSWAFARIEAYARGNSDAQFSFHFEFPKGAAQRHRMAAALADAFKVCFPRIVVIMYSVTLLQTHGYTGECGYNHLLYPTERDTRQMLLWLIQKLPKFEKEESDITSPEMQFRQSLGQSLSRWMTMETPSTPPPQRTPVMSCPLPFHETDPSPGNHIYIHISYE